MGTSDPFCCGLFLPLALQKPLETLATPTDTLTPEVPAKVPPPPEYPEGLDDSDFKATCRKHMPESYLQHLRVLRVPLYNFLKTKYYDTDRILPDLKIIELKSSSEELTRSELVCLDQNYVTLDPSNEYANNLLLGLPDDKLAALILEGKKLVDLLYGVGLINIPIRVMTNSSDVVPTYYVGINPLELASVTYLGTPQESPSVDEITKRLLGYTSSLLWHMVQSV